MTRTPPDSIADVRGLLEGGLRPDAPRSAGALTLVPLTGGLEAPAYLTAAEAFAHGSLAIGEMGGGQVPQLVVKNAGDLPVLLLDGEHLEGAMQNRVLNVSVLVGAMHDTVIPVSCVERGRWGYTGRHDFVPGDDVAYAELRALKARYASGAARAGAGRRVDQGVVWDDIERKRAMMGGRPSRTGAMRDAYDDRRAELEGIVEAFPAPASGQTGVVAFVGDRPLAVDAFDRPSTLASMWPRLVRGYAADALGVAPATVASDAATAFLSTACSAEAEATAHEGVGLGIDVIVTSSSTVATALTWHGGVVHLAVFPTAHRPQRRGPRSRDGRIERPSVRTERRREWFHGGEA